MEVNKVIADLQEKLKIAEARIAELEAENKKLKDRVAKLPVLPADYLEYDDGGDLWP